MSELTDVLIALIERAGEVDRRLAGTEFRGRVHAIDADNHLVQMVIGTSPEGEDVLSPWMPVRQTAGDLKIHSMPSVGQQVAARALSGDIEQASVDKLHWSDGYDPPSKDANLHVLTFGDVKIELSKTGLKITIGQTVHYLTADGLNLKAAHIVNTGQELSHNQINVGFDHRHADVMPGAGISGTPLPI